MTDGWVIFGSTVGGAVVGGAASTLGSLFVARSEVAREARREMYELLPEYLRADSYTDEESLRTAQDALVVIRNRAVVAGKRERELVPRQPTVMAPEGWLRSGVRCYRTGSSSRAFWGTVLCALAEYGTPNRARR